MRHDGQFTTFISLSVNHSYPHLLHLMFVFVPAMVIIEGLLPSVLLLLLGVYKAFRSEGFAPPPTTPATERIGVLNRMGENWVGNSG